MTDLAAPTLAQIFELILAQKVRPFLGTLGFTRDGLDFRRPRGELYDMFGFQNDWHNGEYSWHGFFVNVGIGSTEIDANSPRPTSYSWNPDCILTTRWEHLVPDLPYEVAFNQRTDLDEFAEALCTGLADVIVELEKIESTRALAQWAVANNKLIQMEKTAGYLAAVGENELLTTYITDLRENFGRQERWSIFNRDLIAATGAMATTLVRQGVLDPVADTA